MCVHMCNCIHGMCMHMCRFMSLGLHGRGVWGEALGGQQEVLGWCVCRAWGEEGPRPGRPSPKASAAHRLVVLTLLQPLLWAPRMPWATGREWGRVDWPLPPPQPSLSYYRPSKAWGARIGELLLAWVGIPFRGPQTWGKCGFRGRQVSPLSSSGRRWRRRWRRGRWYRC